MRLLTALSPLLVGTGALAASTDTPVKAVSIPFTKKIVDGPSSSYKRRQHGLRKRAEAGVPVPIYDSQSHMLYLMDVEVGTPPQKFSLQIDTGSSDTWLPSAGSSVCRVGKLCSNGAFQSSSSRTFEELRPKEFQISYVDGTAIVGDYIGDSIKLGGVTVKNQTMALATNARINCNVCPFQGIIGIGYPAGESIVYTEGLEAMYPNIVAQLKNQGHIKSMSYSLWLNDLGADNGEVLFGAVDRKKYKGDLVSLPVLPEEGLPVDLHMSFTVVLDGLAVKRAKGDVAYSRSNLEMPVILDSGTSLTYIDDRIARDIERGVRVVNHPDLDKIVPCELANSKGTFEFRFGGADGPIISVPVGQFVIPFPSSFNVDACQWGIYGSGSDPNLFGDTFLRSAYVVYDLEHNQVALAQALHNVKGSDLVEISSKIPGVKSTALPRQSITATATGGSRRPSEPTGSSDAPVDVSNGGSGSFHLDDDQALAAPSLAPLSLLLSASLAALAVLIF